MGKTFQVALTGDFYDAAGKPRYADLGLGVFEGHPNIVVKSFAGHRPQIGADRLAREGKWDARSGYMGRELRDRTLGVIGCGGIARKLIELLGGWGMKQPLAFDPYLDAATAAKLGVRLVSLQELLKSGDFVSIH